MESNSKTNNNTVSLDGDPEEAREKLGEVHTNEQRSGLKSTRRILELGEDLGQKETQAERIISIKEGVKQAGPAQGPGNVKAAQVTNAAFYTKQTSTTTSKVVHKGNRL